MGGRVVEGTRKRVQGRPVRGEGDVGREKLVDAARKLLRGRVAADVSRKAVAETAGVTPALVSYYFPDKTSLLVAATEPVVGAHLATLHAIFDSADDPSAKLRRLIALFVCVNEAEANLLDHYIDLYRDDAASAPQRLILAKAYRRMFDFFAQEVEMGRWRRMDPDLFFRALWGMCKFAADTTGDPLIQRSDAVTQGANAGVVDVIVDLALHGIERNS